MGDPDSILVEPLRREFLDEVIRIHQAGLGYTMNSKLGADHLAYLYEVMRTDPQCYVGVAIMDGKPAGVISGTTDPSRIKSTMLRAMPLGRAIITAARLIFQPWLIVEWVKESIIARPVIYAGKEVRAVLTAIATDPEFQGRGLGTRLIAELELFFTRSQVSSYRLDTLTTNAGARAFYAKLGFVDVGQRADSRVFVKVIPA